MLHEVFLTIGTRGCPCIAARAVGLGASKDPALSTSVLRLEGGSVPASARYLASLSNAFARCLILDELYLCFTDGGGGILDTGTGMDRALFWESVISLSPRCEVGN